MSGFRIKPTSQLLQPEQPPQPSYYDKNKNLYSYDFESKVPAQVSHEENRPKDSSSKGMAIRIVATGQPDHM